MIFTIDREKTEIPVNPPLEFAEAMLVKAKGASKIVSIGGGSTIDVGKYVAFHLGVPHRAIPTTAGTGSEVTKFAVFIKDGKKWSMEDDRLIPEEYELIPELVVSLPKNDTIASGLDALSQSIESWWSPDSTPESRKYSEEAVGLITACLPGSLRNPDSEFLRMQMMKAANLSGKAINITRTSICHALSYPLTIKYKIPHGIACAMTLPIFMKHFGMEKEAVRKVRRLLRNTGVKDLKADDYDRDYIVSMALESVRAQNTPTPITEEVLEKLI